MLSCGQCLYLILACFFFGYGECSRKSIFQELGSLICESMIQGEEEVGGINLWWCDITRGSHLPFGTNSEGPLPPWPPSRSRLASQTMLSSLKLKFNYVLVLLNKLDRYQQKSQNMGFLLLLILLCNGKEHTIQILTLYSITNTPYKG